jgi:hypothetical protein
VEVLLILLLVRTVTLFISPPSSFFKIETTFPSAHHQSLSRFRDSFLLSFLTLQRRSQRDVRNVQNEQTDEHPVRGCFRRCFPSFFENVRRQGG